MNSSVAHIGIAVTSITDALAFYRDVLGLSPGRPETADGATIVSLHFGAVDVDLAKRGPGIHHICYRVSDLDATLQRCRTAGYELIDETPRLGAGGRRIAFLHPKTTSGILLELTE